MAVQELGMVIGVALIVAVLFFLMLFVEKVWNSTTDCIHDICGRKPKDEENPAALVGTFKRYKNWRLCPCRGRAVSRKEGRLKNKKSTLALYLILFVPPIEDISMPNATCVKVSLIKYAFQSRLEWS